MSTRSIIKRGKNIIRVNDVKGLHDLYRDISQITNNDYQLSVAYIYQQLYTYACQFGSEDMLIWFIEIYYEIFSDMEKIALRQMFIYGKYVANRNKCINNKWYNQCIIPLIKTY